MHLPLGVVELLQTGIKVVDLLCPFIKGGKAGLFGGAGVLPQTLMMFGQSGSEVSSLLGRMPATVRSQPCTLAGGDHRGDRGHPVECRQPG